MVCGDAEFVARFEKELKANGYEVISSQTLSDLQHRIQALKDYFVTNPVIEDLRTGGPISLEMRKNG